MRTGVGGERLLGRNEEKELSTISFFWSRILAEKVGEILEYFSVLIGIVGMQHGR